ncbi:serine hydrolase domain-containing protein [Parasphingorhabdus litoris]|uniref:Serine hydrolase domain-containing protein n=1 Tax=Parasphingorhabdus litoris TaxID=394733 RepID=A0ABN1A0G2_9SPHN|nr:serine hydrolase domain-containing protein [Parasphingorhabdus litoris]
MGKYLVPLFGLAALSLVSFYSYRAFVQEPIEFPLVETAEAVTEDRLPTEPEDWQGTINYRDLDQRIAALFVRPEMAGLAVAIVEDGELRYIRSFGVTDKRSGESVTLQTVFRWASVSKGVAGTLAAKLSEEGQIDLNQTLNQWQTSLKLPGDAMARITVAQLMSHQTGLTKNAFDRKLEDGEFPGLLRARLGTAPLQCSPGTCHSYQNIAFDTAGEILGQATNSIYGDAVQKQLFEPLGMDSARFGMTGLTGAESWARPHRGDKVRILSESYWLLPAAAGVNSNIVDMARWLRAQMSANEDVLSGETLALAHAPLVSTGRVYGGDLARSLSEPSYGLGWRSFTYRGRRLIGHSGAVDGYRATIIFDPAARTGVAAMWNSGWGIPFGIPFAALDSYYGEPADKDNLTDWLDLSDVPPPKLQKPSPRDLP